MDKTFQKFCGVELTSLLWEWNVVKIITLISARQRVPLYLAGQAWTASTFALYEDLVVWSLLSVP